MAASTKKQSFYCSKLKQILFKLLFEIYSIIRIDLFKPKIMQFYTTISTSIRKFPRFIATNRLIIIPFVVLIIYYELRLYRSYLCEDCKLSNTDIKENLPIVKTNTSIDENYLFNLSAKIISLERVGDEFQNLILSIISRKAKNNTLRLKEEDLINMEDVNKYLFK